MRGTVPVVHFRGLTFVRLTFVGCLAAAVPAFGAGPLPFEITDANTGEVLFHGTEASERIGDRVAQVTTYFDPNNQVAARERYATARGTFVEYSFADARTGEDVRIFSREEKSADVSYRGASGEKIHSAEVPLSPATMHGKELVPLILKHWNELENGAEIPCELLVAERLDKFGFIVRRAAEQPAKGAGTRIEAVARNPVIRLFAPVLAFVFDSERRILAFEGPSPLAVEKERHRSVRIVYGAAAH